MNSKIIEQPKEVKPEYPCLKQANTPKGTLIVAFKDARMGIVMLSTHPSFKPMDIIDKIDEEAFDLFPGKIELSN